ncbi:MAG TPA: hypothetical protein DEA22_05210 [Blastocatellia bacterium]|nr:hypothetical protein [Blastocatellia bacterium]
MQDWITLIERCHALEGDLEAWLKELAIAAEPLLGEGHGVAAIAFRGRGDRVEIHAGASSGGLPNLASVAALTNRIAPTRGLELVYRNGLVVSSVSEIFGRDAELLAPIEITSAGEFRDSLGVIAHANVGAGVALSGQVAGRIESVRPVASILRDTVNEFHAVVEALGKNYGGRA